MIHQLLSMSLELHTRKLSCALRCPCMTHELWTISMELQTVGFQSLWQVASWREQICQDVLIQHNLIAELRPAHSLYHALSRLRAAYPVTNKLSCQTQEAHVSASSCSSCDSSLQTFCYEIEGTGISSVALVGARVLARLTK